MGSGQLGWDGLAEPRWLGGSGDQSDERGMLVQESSGLDGAGKEKQRGVGPCCWSE